jgi:chemotaxis family two-component system response regulator Rcp1
VSPTTRTEALELLVLGNAGTELTSDGALPTRLSANVTIASNRPNALALLRKQGQNVAAKRPTLILLDLDGLCEQGWTLLREIKADPQLRRIPVIVLGAVNSGEERARAYDLRANCYMPRPDDKERLGVLLERIEDFWFMRVRLPVGQVV